jgi:hypothetical protein
MYKQDGYLYLSDGSLRGHVINIETGAKLGYRQRSGQK